MRCDQIQEAISARLDGEDPGVDQAAIEAHLAGCEACRLFDAGTAALHRRTRVRAADDVPDLAEAILRQATPVTARPPVREWARYALLAIALTQIVVALPALILGDQSGATVHLARELGSWDVALAAAWLVVAWAPSRAAGLLPFAAVLALVMVTTSVLDLADGSTTLLVESPHVLDLAGLGLIWLMARSTPSGLPLIPGVSTRRT